ncbi:MAG: SlyX family protein [Planctomycetales bacterium]|nr:SlyX family protein [Planctomycetales bacterium]
MTLPPNPQDAAVPADAENSTDSQPSMPNGVERMAHLETLYLHLQRDYQALNEVVTEQTAALERLTRRFDLLMNRLDQLESHVDDHRDPVAEKPPHY